MLADVAFAVEGERDGRRYLFAAVAFQHHAECGEAAQAACHGIGDVVGDDKPLHLIIYVCQPDEDFRIRYVAVDEVEDDKAVGRLAQLFAELLSRSHLHGGGVRCDSLYHRYYADAREVLVVEKDCGFFHVCGLLLVCGKGLGHCLMS